MKYLQSLMNMNSRSTCPRCEGKNAIFNFPGNGFVHNIKREHSKPPSERCKLCVYCTLCDGSGVLIKLIGCSNCKGNGFVHHFRSESEKHNIPFRVRCGLCVDCYKCRGKGAIDPDLGNRSVFAENVAPDSTFGNNFHAISEDLIGNSTSKTSLGPSSLNRIHPHMRGIFERLEQEIGKKKLEKRMSKYSIAIPTKTSSKLVISPLEVAKQVSFDAVSNNHSIENVTPSPEPVKDLGPKFISFRKIMKSTTVDDKNDVSKNFVNVVEANQKDAKSKAQRYSCPKCQGKGWTHTGSAKHSKRKHVKCKFCFDCSGCGGTGLVSDKIACVNCETRGFFHPCTDRAHDIPSHLQCFYCRPCKDCEGSGLVDSKIVKPLQLLNINF